MEMGTVAREDTNLLEYAKVIFGEDLVEKAYLCTWYGAEFSSDEEILERLNATTVALTDGANGDRLTFEDATIRLLFCNGREIEFDSSEWAAISLPAGPVRRMNQGV